MGRGSGSGIHLAVALALALGVAAVVASAARAEEGAPVCEPGPVVGQVLSASGDAWVRGPEGRRRARCGEPIRRCESVLTSPGANVGFLAWDVYVQVDRGSEVVLDPAGADAGFAVGAGRARFVDTRSGEPGSLRLAPAPGSVDPGVDVTVEATGGISDGGVPLSGAAGCVQVGAVGDRFDPGDVALAAPRVSFPPIDPDKRTYEPCELNLCGRPPAPPPSAAPSRPPVEPPGGGGGGGPGFGTEDTVGNGN